jgi:quinol monooxygenase YgiN
MAMYGTVMRARVKAGHKDALQELMKATPDRADLGGFLGYDVGFEDKDPDAIVLVVRFKDKESYVANADSAEQDAEYRRMVEHLESEPEWIDVNWTDTVQAG